MKSIYLILSIIALSHCQILVLDNWVSSTDSGFSQTFQKPQYDWSTNLDFAVYGWFKIDPSVTLTKQSTLFHLTSNVDGDVSINQKPGDYTLGVLYKDSKLSIGTYSSPFINYYNADLNIRSQDLGKWTFFYVGYSSSQQKVFHHFEFNGQYFTSGQMSGINHITSDVQKLFVGLQNTFEKFPGQISKVYIHAGTGAYRESNFSEIIPQNPYNASLPNCPILYTECNQKGTQYSLCSQGQIPLTSIKSIYVPEGYTVTVTTITGKKIAYTQNVACLSTTIYGISASNKQ